MSRFRKFIVIILAVILAISIAGLISIWISSLGGQHHTQVVSKAVTQPVVKPTPITIPVNHKVLVNKVVTINGIGFKFNEYKLMSGDMPSINKVLVFAKKNPEAILTINGYSSKMGTYSYNSKLSLKRALTVKKYLEKNGIPNNRMKTIGHSYNDPIDTNATPQGRFKNQRVTVTSTTKVEK